MSTCNSTGGQYQAIGFVLLLTKCGYSPMITLDTLVVDITAPGFYRRAGEYICGMVEGEVLGQSLDEVGKPVDIMAAGNYEHNSKRDLIEIKPDGYRSGFGTICDYATDVATLSYDYGIPSIKWVIAADLRPGWDHIITPVLREGGIGLCPKSFTVRQYRAKPESYAVGVSPTMVKILLRRPARYFTTLACVLSNFCWMDKELDDNLHIEAVNNG